MELRYIASQPGDEDFTVWRSTPQGPVPSLANIRPALNWYEREISDLFGVEFAGQPEARRLVFRSGVRRPLRR